VDGGKFIASEATILARIASKKLQAIALIFQIF
jgi:hypothetical protein